MPSNRQLESDENLLVQTVKDKNGLRVSGQPKMPLESPKPSKKPSKHRGTLTIPSDEPPLSADQSPNEVGNNNGLRVDQPSAIENLDMPNRRFSNLYDAVAARVTARGFRTDQPFASKYRDTASSGARALRPEEVLFRKERLAKQPIDETYFAHEALPSDQPLPPSELLKTLHVYAADYFELATADNGNDDSGTMDGTALLAMGILIEELAKEALGDTGDLVLVEGEELSEDEEDIDLKNNIKDQLMVSPARKEPVPIRVLKSSKRRKSSRSGSVPKGVGNQLYRR